MADDDHVTGEPVDDELAGEGPPTAAARPLQPDAALQFFVDGASRSRTAERSVFGRVDQDTVLSRLAEGGSDEEHDADFFATNLLPEEVDRSSVLAAGLSTVVSDQLASGSGPYAPPPQSEDDALASLGPTCSQRLAADPVAQRRFVLAGPQSLVAS